MSLWLIIIIIWALYYKTLKSYFLIDDYTPRHRYPIPETEAKDPKFYMTKPHWWVHPFMITMHCVNTAVIYLIWGWAPALIFAVHPMAMWGTAWLTGNWYCTTTYFLLISYYFIHTFPMWGWIPGIGLFWASMYSTFDAVPFPFVLLFSGNLIGLPMLYFTALFLNGKKFRHALDIRKDINKGKVIDRTDFPINRLAFMTKVVARYTYETIIPMRVKLFDNWAESIRDYQEVYDDMHSWNRDFWMAVGLILSVFIFGFMVSPIGIFWFFGLITLHCQFNLVGQTYAQRYIYVALPGLCVVAGTALSSYPTIVVAIAGFFACRTFLGMNKWITQENMLMDDIDQVPERGSSYGLLGQFYLTIMPLNEYQPFMINMISYLLRKAVATEPRSWQMRMNMAAYLCKTGHVDEGLKEMDATIELLRKYACDREEGLINSMIEQKKNWTKIGKDLDLRKELEKRTTKSRIITPE